MEKEVKTPTLCWTCRNAVPKIVNGKYICGCSWSVHLRPVKGWTAEKSIKNANSANKIETWNVLDCPEYKEDKPEEEIFVVGGGEIYKAMLPYCQKKGVRGMRTW